MRELTLDCLDKVWRLVGGCESTQMTINRRGIQVAASPFE